MRALCTYALLMLVSIVALADDHPYVLDGLIAGIVGEAP